MNMPVTVGHPIFNDFKAFDGSVPAGFSSDFIGSIIDNKFYYEPDVADNARVPIGEEYFEWISLLTAAKSANGRFTVAELGAGYGRWAARAILAARQCGISNVRAILVEAEPMHVAWSKEHMANNKISNFKVIEAAIGGQTGQQLFLVRQPGQTNAAENSRSWYGQAIDPNARTNVDLRTVTQDTYCGRPIIDNGGGWGGINIDVITLSEVLARRDMIDLLDMDIQGAEADVIEAGIDLLNKQVRLVHIGTHSPEVEARIRTMMTRHKWKKIWDFPCQSTAPTPYGEVVFGDGVQAWENPRFEFGKQGFFKRLFG